MKVGFHAHDIKTHSSLSHNSCTHKLMIQANISAATLAVACFRDLSLFTNPWVVSKGLVYLGQADNWL